MLLQCRKWYPNHIANSTFFELFSILTFIIITVKDSQYVKDVDKVTTIFQSEVQQ
jgi:hypothetical protein